jgi:hypothetical protein
MSTNQDIQFDQTKSEQFAEKMMTINYGALNLMISIGYRTGLFDAMSELSPAPASTKSRLNSFRMTR